MEHRGAPYVWGGARPAGFDCSGFVLYVFAKAGIALPHNVAQQYRHGVPVTREELEPGDLVFFDHLRHNGIYIGQGRFIHAARSGKSVVISRLDDRWYESRWAGGRRLSSVASTARRE
jgi:cell wall-associated NlpC family hydrolase